MNIIRSSGRTLFANIVGAISIFIGLILFSRILSAETIGSFFLFQALLGLLSILADFGIRGALEKRISENQRREQIVSAAILIKTPVLASIAIVILIFRLTINSYIGADVTMLLVLALFTRESFLTIIHTLNGELRVGETASLKLVQKVLWISTAVGLITIGYGIHGIIYGLMAGHIVSSIWGGTKISILPRYPTFEEIYSLLNYAVYNLVADIGGYAYNWIDIAVIGIFLTNAYVSSYEFAWRVTEVVILFSNSLAVVLFPQVSYWMTDGSKSKVENLLENAIHATIYIVIPAFFGTLLFADEILRLLFGLEYTIASVALIILMAEAIVQSLHKLFSRALLGVDKPSLTAIATTVSVSTNVCLNLLLIPLFGLPGAAIATSASFMLNTAIHVRYLSEFITIKGDSSVLFLCVLCSIIMSAILLLLKSQVTINSLSTLLIIVMTGAILYVIMTLMFRSLRTELLRTLNSARSNL